MTISTMGAKERGPASFNWHRPHHWLAYGFGSGLSPWAPGTAGTLAAIPLYLLLQPLPITWYLTAVMLMFLIGIWACGETAREMGVQDPTSIVWDEVLGFLVTMMGAPPGWHWIPVGFVLFRFFDILKPWPIYKLDQRVKGGIGIMLDDLVAGVMALIVLQIAMHILG